MEPPRAAPRRRSGRLLLAVVAAVLAGVAVAAVIVLNPFGGGPRNSGPLHIGSDVKLTAQPTQGGCDTTFNFAAKGSVTGVGTLTFRWERSDGLNSPDTQVSITSDEGSFALTNAWRIQGHQQVKGSMTFRILSPQPSKVVQTITYTC
jgi:opacity protein-like surface antigen